MKDRSAHQMGKRLNSTGSKFFENHITMNEFLELLKHRYSKHTVYRWVGQGIPHKRLSGKLWFPKEEAVDWLLRKG